jgi:hypothetical protein
MPPGLTRLTHCEAEVPATGAFAAASRMTAANTFGCEGIAAPDTGSAERRAVAGQRRDLPVITGEIDGGGLPDHALVKLHGTRSDSATLLLTESDVQSYGAGHREFAAMYGIIAASLVSWSVGATPWCVSPRCIS